MMKLFSKFCLLDLKVEEMKMDQYDPSIKSEFFLPMSTELTSTSRNYALE